MKRRYLIPTVGISLLAAALLGVSALRDKEGYDYLQQYTLEEGHPLPGDLCEGGNQSRDGISMSASGPFYWLGEPIDNFHMDSLLPEHLFIVNQTGQQPLYALEERAPQVGVWYETQPYDGFTETNYIWAPLQNYHFVRRDDIPAIPGVEVCLNGAGTTYWRRGER